MKHAFSLTLLILGLSVSLLAVYSYRYFSLPLNIAEEGYYFELKRGDTLSHLSTRLKNDKVISNALLFKLYSRITGVDKKLHAGEYQIPRGDNLLDLFEQFKKGSNLRYSITFVEGWNYKQLFSAIKKDQGIVWSGDEQTIKQELGLQDQHLEGQFFADTYYYSKGESANNILKASHIKLWDILEEEWQGREQNLPLDSPYEALILASIVEKETSLASERPLIAGVFINRLNISMRLQTDPTVIYGMGDSYEGKIRKKHLLEYTPYNTYRIPALPPTPIAIVGRESINAVLHPLKSDYFYFVAKGDGSHYFSSTYEEHQRAIQQFQLKRASNYRSTPSK